MSVSAEAEQMSAEQARDRFGDALDGTLGAAEQRLFDAALAADAELADEYEAYRAIVKGVASAAPHVAGLEGAASSAAGEVAPSLVPRVQDRLRRRSKGRFFRDRFSAGEARGSSLTVLLVTAVFLVLVATWLMLDNVELLAP